MTVTVQFALNEVQASCRRLREVARELVLTAVEDQPRDCQVHLITVVHDAALDVAAEAEQADAALSAKRTAKGTPPHMVACCQHHITLLGATLVRELAAPELLNDLAALGRERGGEVSAWAGEIMSRIQACQLAVWTDMQPALLAYWQELADIADRSRGYGDGC